MLPRTWITSEVGGNWGSEATVFAPNLRSGDPVEQSWVSLVTGPSGLTEQSRWAE